MPSRAHLHPRGGTGTVFLTATAALLLAAIAVLAFVFIKSQPMMLAPAQPASAPASAETFSSGPAAKPATSTKPGEGVIRFGREAAIPKPPGAVRIATYNIENFFDEQSSIGPSGKPDPQRPAKPESERKAVADAIRKLDADVLAVEEAGSKDTLVRFRDKYLDGMGYDYIESPDAGDERGIQQGVLSRFEITDAAQWVRLPLGGEHPAKLGREPNPDAGKPITFHRSPLRVTIVVPIRNDTGSVVRAANHKIYEVTLFVIHQKSGGQGGYWRQEEATKTANLAKAFEHDHPDASVIILGDFNVASNDSTMQAYTEAGLTDAFADLPDTDPTIVTHTAGRTIDHILMNQSALAHLVKDTRVVLGTPTRPEDVDWRTTPNPKGWASDHYPVVIDLKP